MPPATTTTDDDALTATTGLTAEQRRERARRGGRAAHSLDSHLRRLIAAADQLTPDQVNDLINAIGADIGVDIIRAAAYQEGVTHGAQQAKDALRKAIERALREAADHA